jgi:hypothetical protein
MAKPTIVTARCPYKGCRWTTTSLFESSTERRRENHMTLCQHRPTSATKGTSTTR